MVGSLEIKTIPKGDYTNREEEFFGQFNIDFTGSLNDLFDNISNIVDEKNDDFVDVGAKLLNHLSTDIIDELLKNLKISVKQSENIDKYKNPKYKKVLKRISRNKKKVKSIDRNQFLNYFSNILKLNNYSSSITNYCH